MSTFERESIRITFYKNLTRWRTTPQCNLEGHDDQCGCLKPFTRIVPLKEWMKEKDSTLGKCNGELLFDEVDPYKTRPHPSAETILKKSTLVFSWLVKAEYGRLIHIFHRAKFDDDKLRDIKCRLIKDTDLQDEYEQHVRDHRDSVSFKKLTKDLEALRWEFCPYTLDEGLDNEAFGTKLIMPFSEQWAVTGQGATSVVCLAIINKEFVSENIRRSLGHASEFPGHDGLYYQLAVKRIMAAGRETYSQERWAFKGIHNKGGMLRCFGSYSTMVSTTKWYNILLEPADENMHEFFASFGPPQLSSEIYSEWDEICKIAAAIETLHNFDYEGAPWSGWHGDIKPRNILRVGKEWKLADYGFTVFHEKSQERFPKAKLKERTETWGAPETTRHDEDLLQTIDTWSFGCVLSIVATWMVKDIKGVLEYQEYRSQNRPSDAFHHDNSVLPEIRTWHEHLKQLVRKSDNITEKILDLVDHSLLLMDPRNRLTSSELWAKLQEILYTAKQSLQKEVPMEGGLSKALQCIRDHPERIDSYNSAASDGNDGTIPIALPPTISRLPHTNPVERSGTLHPPIRVAQTKISDSRPITSFQRAQSSSTVSRGHVPLPSLEQPVVTLPHPGVSFSNSSSGLQSEPLQRMTTVDTAETSATISEHRPSDAGASETSQHETLSTNGDSSADNHRSSISTLGSPVPTLAGDLDTATMNHVWKSVQTVDKDALALSVHLDRRDFWIARRTDEDGCTPIMVAAKKNHLAAVNLLIEHSNLSLCDRGQKTILHHLVEGQYGRGETYEFLETLRCILGHEHSREGRFGWINQTDNLHHTCLFLCVRMDMPKAIKALLREGAMIDGMNIEPQYLPLAEAVRLGKEHIIRVMLKEDLSLWDKGVSAPLREVLEKNKGKVPGIWKDMKAKMGEAKPQKISRSRWPSIGRKKV